MARKKKVDPTMTGVITEMVPALQEALGDTPFKVIDMKCARCGNPMVLTATVQTCSIQCPKEDKMIDYKDYDPITGVGYAQHEGPNPEVNNAIEEARKKGSDTVVVKFSEADGSEFRGTIYLDNPNTIDVPGPMSREVDVGAVRIINAGVPANFAYKVMATGHRDFKEGTEKLVFMIMRDIFMFLAESKEKLLCISGGALGVDMMWARAAYSLEIPFRIVVPNKYEEIFIARPGKFNPAKTQAECVENLRKFRKMLDLAQSIERIGQQEDEYTPGDNNRRNHAMVKQSNAAVVVCKYHPHEVLRDKKLKGGTIDAIRKLHKEGFQDVFFIDWNNPDGYSMVNLQDA